MKSIDLLLYLKRNKITVFRTSDIAKITKKPLSYTKSVIGRIPGIKKAEKGLYFIDEATIYEIASNFVPFSYVSMLSALKYYELTTQMPVVIDVVSPKKHRPVMVEGYKIKFDVLKSSLIFGFVRRGNAFIASPEKAILDSLYAGNYAYLDEVLETGFREKIINKDLLVKYAILFNKKTLLNKLGFFLDFYAGVSLPELLKIKSKNPVYLIKNANSYNKKWGVYYGK